MKSHQDSQVQRGSQMEVTDFFLTMKWVLVFLFQIIANFNIYKMSDFRKQDEFHFVHTMM